MANLEREKLFRSPESVRWTIRAGCRGAAFEVPDFSDRIEDGQQDRVHLDLWGSLLTSELDELRPVPPWNHG